MKLRSRLFSKRCQPLRWLFLLIALPFLALSLPNEYSTSLYAIPGVICLLQFVFPTLAGWMFILGGFIGLVVIYGYTFMLDLIYIYNGKNPSIFLDADDTAVVILFYGLCLFVTFLIYRSKPDETVKVIYD